MIGVVAGKEFRDHLTSRRFLIFFGFLLVVTVLSLISVKLNLQTWTQGNNPKVYEVMYGVTSNIEIIGAIFAIALGFDAVTREREERTLPVLMSHPVFRDQVILGKILGGAVTLAFAVLITGLAVTGMLLWAGIEVGSYARLATYFLFAYVYLFLFFTMAVAFSAYAKNSGNALMYSLVAFLALIMVVTSVAPIIAHVIVGPQPKMPPELKALQSGMASGNVSMDEYQKYQKLMEEYQNKTLEWSRRYWKVQEYINVLSPVNDLFQISEYVLNPQMKSGEMFNYGPNMSKETETYSLTESLSFVKKEVVTLFAYIALWTILAYLGFVRAEIR